MNKEQLIKEFREKYDKKKILFKKDSGEVVYDDMLLEDIEKFWLKALKGQKETKEALTKKIEGMKKKIHDDLTTKQPEDIEGYNKAIEEILKEIK